MVTRDGGIPVLSRAYPGNRPDVTQFTAVIDELVTRYARSGGGGAGELTVIFDAGQRTRPPTGPPRRARACTTWARCRLPALRDLLAMPARRYQLVDQDRFGGLTACDTPPRRSAPSAG